MDWVVELLISKYLWWLIAIVLNIITIWVTFSAIQMKIALGLPINIFVKILWVATIVVWLFILARSIIEYILENTMAQIIIFAIVVLWLWFGKEPVKTTKPKKRGARR